LPGNVHQLPFNLAHRADNSFVQSYIPPLQQNINLQQVGNANLFSPQRTSNFVPLFTPQNPQLLSGQKVSSSPYQQIISHQPIPAQSSELNSNGISYFQNLIDPQGINGGRIEQTVYISRPDNLNK
jgi:hypothetical protein